MELLEIQSKILKGEVDRKYNVKMQGEVVRNIKLEIQCKSFRELKVQSKIYCREKLIEIHCKKHRE